MNNQIMADSSAQDELLDNRYRLDSLLKQEKDIETWQGLDVSTQQAVIVKAVPRSHLAESTWHRLEYELWALKDLQSPSLCFLNHIVHDDERICLIRPFVTGQPAHEAMEKGPMGQGKVIEIARCLLEALQEMHERGVVYRYLKPTRILLQPQQQAVLTHFGLARHIQRTAPIRLADLRPLHYISPEQAGLLSQGVDPRSDLYSLGLILYELLAGYPPFRADNLSELLRIHLTTAPPPLATQGRDIHQALDDMVQRLLRKDPRDRYQSAGAVLADLQELSEALKTGTAELRLAIGRHDRRPALTEASFIGRREELKRLESTLSHTRQGQGSLVLLEAESGCGKTWLLEELIRRSMPRSCWILRGQGVEHAARRPFQVLEGLVREMMGRGCEDPSFAKSLYLQLAEKAEILCAVFPSLTEIWPWVLPASEGPDEYGENRTLAALGAWLEALGTRDNPALIMLDDCQWSDEQTLRFLAYWQRQRKQNAGVPCFILLVLSFRSEEVRPEHPLRSLQADTHLTLSPFGATEVHRQLQSMAGKLPLQASNVILNISAGNPFMVAAMLRGMVETGALKATPNGWEVDPVMLGDLQASQRAAVLLIRQLEHLPAGVLRLLSVGAILGKEFELETVALLSKLPPTEAIAGLHRACRGHIVWSNAPGTRYTFIHDKLREALLERLSREELKQIHYQAALHLEAKFPDRCFELAYHFNAAGDPLRALSYALSAGAQARSQYALEVAELQYRIAEQAPAPSQDTTLQIAENLGDVLMLRGKYKEAALRYQTALALATSAAAQAQVEGKRGELAFKCGDMRMASEALERALSLLGKSRVSRPGHYLLALVWEAGIQILHTLLPGLFLARKSLAGAETELLAIRLYSRLAYAYWFERGKIACMWAHLREMNLAEAYPPTPQLAQAYSNHAPAMTMVPYFSRGIAYVKKALRIRQDLGDRWGQGQALNFYGVVLYASAHFTEALDTFQQAARLLKQTGDRWEENTANWHIAFCLYRKGRLEEAVQAAQEVYRIGREIGDTQASGISLSIWSKASEGQVPAELLQEELANPSEDIHTTAELLQAEAIRCLRLRQPQDAVSLLQKADRLIANAGLRQEYIAPVLPWLATALRETLEQLSPYVPLQRRGWLAQLRKTVRRAVALARHYPNNLPHALREKALLEAMLNRPRRARQSFERSLGLALRQHARYEHAKSLLARGQTGVMLGWPDAEQDLALARHALHTMREEKFHPGDGIAPGESASLALIARFAKLLESGRHIITSLSRDEVFAAVHQEILTLLRAEECQILEVSSQGPAGDPYIVSGNIHAPYSRSLVKQVLTSGKSAIVTEGLPQDAHESILLAKVRSVLCTPIRVLENVTGCIYVSHGQISDLFGEEEIKLSEFIATLTGAALENAEGFSRLQAVTEELKRSNEDLQQFAYVASHDLQEPLRMVSSYIQLLAHRYRDQLDKDALKFIDFAVAGASRMRTLIQDLLAYSRTGTQEMPLEPVACESILQQAMHNLETTIKETQAQITHEQLPLVIGNEGQLIQLFQNLLGNAIKFRGQKTPQVFIRTELRDNQWLFAIADNGIGIAPEYAERIFVIFQRLHHKEKYTGNGIGLALCKKIVERHRGQIWLESEPGVGSTFYFTLPVS